MKQRAAVLSNLLIYRWLLANLAIAAALVLPTMGGYTTILFTEDTSYISHAIAALFFVAWAWNARETWRVSKWRNALKRGVPAYRASILDQDKAMSKIEWLNKVPDWLVGLGLLGTVIGFKVAMGAVDQGSLSNAAGVQTSIGVLMDGITIAINTTIVGAVCGLWLEVNNRILKTAAESYWADRRMPQ